MVNIVLGIALLICVVGAGSVIYFLKHNENYIEEWKEKYVIPFVEQLPSQKMALIDYEIKGISKSDDHLFPKDVKDNSLFKVEIKFVDDEDILLSKEIIAIFKYDLSEGESPYLEVKNLEEDLGNGITKGWVTPVIHLPTNDKGD